MAEKAVKTLAEMTPKEKAAYYNEKVKIKLFKDNDRYADDVFVAVNGKTFIIKRGIEVEVPRYLAKMIADGERQDISTAELIASQTDKTE